MGLSWNGDAIEDRMVKAARKGVDVTTAEGANYAKEHHPWQNRTGTAEGSIQSRPAIVIEGGLVRGEFGSYGVDYFIWLEIGTNKMGAMPCLRPALDVVGKRLAGNIKRAWDEL